MWSESRRGKYLPLPETYRCFQLLQGSERGDKTSIHGFDREINGAKTCLDFLPPFRFLWQITVDVRTRGIGNSAPCARVRVCVRVCARLCVCVYWKREAAWMLLFEFEIPLTLSGQLAEMEWMVIYSSYVENEQSK